MAKVTVYKNSKLATVCSFLGYLLMVIGIYLMFNEEAGAGAAVMAVGIAFKLLAGFISKKKAQKEAKNNQVV